MKAYFNIRLPAVTITLISTLCFYTSANADSIIINDPDPADNQENVVIGVDASVTGANNVAVGHNAQTTGFSSTAVGESALAGQEAVAIGDDTQATGRQATAVGDDATANAEGATALGNEADASGNSSIAIGLQAEGSGGSSTAIGSFSRATGDLSIAIGDSAASEGQNGIAIGTNSRADGQRGIAIGSNAQANVEEGIAIGESSTATLGRVEAGNVISGPQIIGTLTITEGTDANGEANFGDRLITGVADGRIESGSSDAINGHQMFELATQLETNAAALDEISNGDANGSVGIGGGTASGANSVAVGLNSEASGDSSTALGSNSQATADNSVALGAGSVADAPNTVSVGSAGNERRITNVADGVLPTDTATFGQLTALSNANNLRFDELTRGLAISNAMQMFMPDSDKSLLLYVGGGTHDGTNAVALTASGRIGPVGLHFGVGADTEGETVDGAVGMSVQW